jgi:glyoxylase I family protein
MEPMGPMPDKEAAMAISTGPVHHVTLTVTDVARSENFYTTTLGFKRAATLGSRSILSNDQFLLVLTPPPEPARAIAGDRFSENRVGLDHLSISVASRAELEAAKAVLEQRGGAKLEVKDLADFKLLVLAFRDPDNIQIELAASY